MVAETTALGAAYAAGIATGYWQGEQDVIDNRAEGDRGGWQPLPADMPLIGEDGTIAGQACGSRGRR